MEQPMQIKRVSVEGYRVLKSTSFEPQGLNVLIGANGSGKSTVLDLFALLAEAMGGKLPKAISERGGINRLLTLGGPTRLRLKIETTPVGWPASVTESPLLYELVIMPSGIGYAIASELLIQDRGHSSGKPLAFLERDQGFATLHDTQDLSLALPLPVPAEQAAFGWLPRMSLEPETLRSLLATSLYMPPLVLDARSPLRLPQTLQPPDGAPNASGSDLISSLYEMRSADEDLWEQLTDVLNAGFPRFRKLEFPMVAGGQAALAWYEKDSNAPLYANELSTGTLRFLHLAAMLLSSKLPGLVLLDEPELSLHPELLRLLSELLIQASQRSQILVATHSSALVRWVSPEQVVVVERDDAGCSLKRGSELNLTHWLDTYTLDQIWQMGLMGGKP